MEARPVLDRLRSSLKEEVYQKLEGKETLSLSDFDAAGIEHTFDWNLLSLTLLVPAEHRIPKTHVLRRRRPNYPESEITIPAPFSAYTNFRFSQDFLHRDDDISDKDRRLNRARTDGAVNILDWVFEFSADYQKDKLPKVARGDLTLVRHFPKTLISLQLGDLNFPTTGQQSSRHVGGISIRHDDDLQPYRTIFPVSKTELLLKERSLIKILVRGREAKSLLLEPGLHRFDDIPVDVGDNDIELHIRNNFGETEIVQLNFLFEPRMLAPGYHQWAFCAGFPITGPRGERIYTEQDPALSFFYRRGINPNLTLAVYGQGDFQQSMLGVETHIACLWGYLTLDKALSSVYDLTWDFATELSWQNYLEQATSGTQCRISTSYRGEEFAALGNLEPSNSTAYRFSASASRPLFAHFFVRLSSDYQIMRGDNSNPFSIGLQADRSWKSGWQLRTEGSYRKMSSAKTEFNIVSTLTWRDTERHQTWQVTRDENNRKSAFQWQYASPRAVQAINGALNYDHKPERERLEGKVSYKGHRLEGDFKHNLSNNKQAGSVRQKTTLNLASSVVFAGGKMGISRPVVGSFALVVPKKKLRGTFIGINPKDEIYEATVKPFFGGVKTSLPAYRVAKMLLLAPYLERGHTLGKDLYWLRPHYKSGFLIEVGSEAMIFLGGQLVDKEGKVIALQGGQLIPVGKESSTPQPFFTSRKGKFRISGIKAGSYGLRFFGETSPRAVITVPEDAEGLYDLGTLQLPDEP